MSDDDRRHRDSGPKWRSVGDATNRSPSDGDGNRHAPTDNDDNFDFDSPTRPRGRTLAESSEPPRRPAWRDEEWARQSSQDSFHPVRVAPRSVRPPLSLWTHAWVTAALIVVVGGGALGVVGNLRRKPLGFAGRPETSVEVPPVVAPPTTQAAPITVAVAPSAEPSASAAVAPEARLPASSSSAEIAQRMATSRAAVPSSGSNERHAIKPEPTSNEMSAESADDDSDLPEATGAAPASPAASATSEAWVTEERRF